MQEGIYDSSVSDRRFRKILKDVKTAAGFDISNQHEEDAPLTNSVLCKVFSHKLSVKSTEASTWGGCLAASARAWRPPAHPPEFTLGCGLGAWICLDGTPDSQCNPKKSPSSRPWLRRTFITRAATPLHNCTERNCPQPSHGHQPAPKCS